MFWRGRQNQHAKARALPGIEGFPFGPFCVRWGLPRTTMETPALATTAKKRFCLILVKPSHYDDDGYVIQWLRSTIPSNSLAALYGLALDCKQRHVLGEDVEIEIHPFDETNTRIRPRELAAMIEQAGDGMVMFVGVQSNQFPHMLDLAKPLLERGVQIAVGGFHVSGTMSMLGGNDADIHRDLHPAFQQRLPRSLPRARGKDR